MGGKGPGHKSPRARHARLINIQKARAARRRAPLPWRSGIESRVIEQLVWQWWQSPAPRWPAYRVARLLGVSHTWVNKLAKRFKSDPARFRRRHAPSPQPLSKSSSAPARKLSGAAGMAGFADPFACAASVIPSTTARPAARASPPKPACPPWRASAVLSVVEGPHPWPRRACPPWRIFPPTSSATSLPGHSGVFDHARCICSGHLFTLLARRLARRSFSEGGSLVVAPFASRCLLPGRRE